MAAMHYAAALEMLLLANMCPEHRRDSLLSPEPGRSRNYDSIASTEACCRYAYVFFVFGDHACQTRSPAHLEDGREQRPGRFQLVIANEQPLVAVDDIQDETLICIWQDIFVTRFVGQIKLGDIQVETQSRHLVVDLEVDGLVGLDANHLQQSTVSMTQEACG